MRHGGMEIWSICGIVKVLYYFHYVVVDHILGIQNLLRFIDYMEADSITQQAVIALLIQHFYENEPHELVRERIVRSIQTDEQIVKCMKVDGQFVGVTTYKIFDWDRLKKQLYLQTQCIGDIITHLRLLPFQDVLGAIGITSPNQHVAELSYTVITDEFRGQGVQTQAFNERLREIISQLEDAIVFTIAMSRYQGTDVNHKLTQFMLDVEATINGKNDKGSVNVLGEWVTIEAIENGLSLRLSPFLCTMGSPQTRHLAEKFGLKYAGLSRNLSPVYASTLADMKL